MKSDADVSEKQEMEEYSFGFSSFVLMTSQVANLFFPDFSRFGEFYLFKKKEKK